MRKTVLTGIVILIITVITFLVSNKYDDHRTTRRLNHILIRLNEINSVSYYCKEAARGAGETVTSDSLFTFIRMYTNAGDKIVGAGFAYSYKNVSTRYDGCYDGNNVVQLKWDSKGEIDKDIIAAINNLL